MDKCEDLSLVIDSLVPAMMDPILGDYARNVPDARYKLSPSCAVLKQATDEPQEVFMGQPFHSDITPRSSTQQHLQSVKGALQCLFYLCSYIGDCILSHCKATWFKVLASPEVLQCVVCS